MQSGPDKLMTSSMDASNGYKSQKVTSQIYSKQRVSNTIKEDYFPRQSTKIDNNQLNEQANDS